MAYKFQLGNAKLGGNLEIATGSSFSGSLSNTGVDDGTVDNIVAELDNASIQATKLALATDPALEAVNQGGVEKLQLKIEANKGLTKGASGVAVVPHAAGSIQVSNNGVGVVIKANNGLGHDGTNGMVAIPDGAKGMEVSSAGLAVKLRANKGLGLHSDGVEIQPENNKGIGLSSNGIAVLVNANASAQVDSNGVGVMISNNKGIGHDGTSGLQVLLQADKGLGVGAGGLTAVVDADALQLGSSGIDLKDTIAGNRTFSGNLTVNGTASIDGDLVINGTTTTLNTNELLVEDKIIQIAKNANSEATSKDSGILFGQGNANGARLLYEVDGGQQKLKAKQGSGGQLIKMEASEFIGPATKGAIIDEENVNAARLILFADNTGAQDFKSDGDFTYNSGLNGGTLSAPRFAGSGQDLTNLPVGTPLSANRNPNDALNLNQFNILTSGGSDGVKVFRIPNSANSGDRIWIKAPNDAAPARSMKITGSLAGPGLTVDGANFISLESADAAVMLVFTGGTAWRVF